MKIDAKNQTAPRWKTMSLPAKTQELHKLLDFISSELSSCGFQKKFQIDLEIAAEEVFTNIALYAYSGNGGTAVVSLCADSVTREVSVRFEDSGIPYNPLARPDPDITLSAGQRQVGGLGIYLVKQIADHVEYEYRDGHNMLTFTKKESS